MTALGKIPEYSDSNLEAEIGGSLRDHLLDEFLSNSVYYPLFNSIYEISRFGLDTYLANPVNYALWIGTLAQTYFLTWNKSNTHIMRFAGNLIGPAIYTVFGILIESNFFQSANIGSFIAAPNHFSYWLFAILIGLAQEAAAFLSGAISTLTAIVENILRIAMVMVLYSLLVGSAGSILTILNLSELLPSLNYLITATILLGILHGMRERHYLVLLNRLRELTIKLKTLSEWTLGRDVVENTLLNRKALEVREHAMTPMFMDIRGFSAWVQRTSPTTVVSMLNGYYAIAEKIINGRSDIPINFRADEVMTAFIDPVAAVRVAWELREACERYLSPLNLHAGVGLQTGTVLQGMLGGIGVKTYTIIGDTVNAAKRVESLAGPGQVLIGLETYRLVVDHFDAVLVEKAAGKAKEEAIVCYRIIRELPRSSAEQKRGMPQLGGLLQRRDQPTNSMQR